MKPDVFLSEIQKGFLKVFSTLSQIQNNLQLKPVNNQQKSWREGTTSGHILYNNISYKTTEKENSEGVGQGKGCSLLFTSVCLLTFALLRLFFSFWRTRAGRSSA